MRCARHTYGTYAKPENLYMYMYIYICVYICIKILYKYDIHIYICDFRVQGLGKPEKKLSGLRFTIHLRPHGWPWRLGALRPEHLWYMPETLNPRMQTLSTRRLSLSSSARRAVRVVHLVRSTLGRSTCHAISGPPSHRTNHGVCWVT